MGTPHKHADLIKAWADGAEIQCRDGTCPSLWDDITCPSWSTACDYRIKPEPKPDFSMERRIEAEGQRDLIGRICANPNVKFTFDGETHKLKKVEIVGE